MSCTIITVGPNSLMESIHNRMPVILGEEDIGRWLGKEAATAEEIAALVRPFEAARMRAWPVSKEVGKVANKQSNLLDPISIDAA